MSIPATGTPISFSQVQQSLGGPRAGFGNVYVANVSTLMGNVSIGANTASAYALSVFGSVNLTGAFLSNGAPYVASQWLNSANNIYFSNGVSIGSSAAPPAGGLNVAGNINFAGQLLSNGVAYKGSQFINTGNNIYFANAVTIGSTATPQSSLDVYGNQNVVAGRVALIGSYAASWDHWLLQHDGATASLLAGGAESGIVIGVNNGTTPLGNATYNTALAIAPNAAVTCPGVLTVSNLFNATGAAQLSSTLTVGGTTNVTGALTSGKFQVRTGVASTNDVCLFNTNVGTAIGQRMLRYDDGGNLSLNAATGSGITLAVNDVNKVTMSSAGDVAMSNNLTVTGSLASARAFDDPLQAKLALQYDFKAGTGLVVQDRSSFANNGTMPSGTFSWSSTTPYDGLVGSYVNVTTTPNGSTYWNCAFNSAITCGTAFTASLWWYFAGVSAGGSYYTLLSGTGATSIPLILSTTGGVGYFNASGFVSSSYMLTTKQWYHLGMVVNGSTWQLYVNGTLQTTMTSYTGTTTLTGLGQGGASNVPTGKFEDVRVWTRALNAREIGTMYSQKTLGPSVLADVNSNAVTVPGTLNMGNALVNGAFPPPMTSATMNGFTVTASSFYTGNASINYFPYFAFDKAAYYSAWAAVNYLSGSNGTYNGSATTTVNGTSVGGEWIQVQTPFAYNITSYTIIDSQIRNITWTLAGSMDGNLWSLLDSRSLPSVPITATYTTSNSPTAYYSYFRLIVQVVNGSSACNIDDLVFTGSPAAQAPITFPAVALTAAQSNSYSVTASTFQGGYEPQLAFDKGASRWASAVGIYNSGPYAGSVSTTVSGVAITGEWLQMVSPVAFSLINYVWWDSAGRNKSWTLAGSTDGSTWVLLDSRNLGTVVSTATTYSIGIVPAYYNYYRVIVQSVVSGQGNSDLQELTFYGQPTPGSGNLSVTGNLRLANPPTTTFLQFTGAMKRWYNDPGPGTLVGSFTSLGGVCVIEMSAQAYRTSAGPSAMLLILDDATNGVFLGALNSYILTVNQHWTFPTGYFKATLAAGNHTINMYVSDNYATGTNFGTTYSNLTARDSNSYLNARITCYPPGMML